MTALAPNNTDHRPDRPKWSVIIPVHNCADYLGQALPGVLDQLADRDDAEIIVVDDNSDDDPAAVIQRIGRGRVLYRPNPTHLGAIATFNRCLTLAHGEFMHLLHGDDLVLPDFYATMEGALSDPASAAAVCRVQDITVDRSSTYITRSYRTGTGTWDNALQSLVLSNRIRPPGIVVRRTIYEQVGPFRTDLPHAADWEMWVRIAAHGPVMFVDDVLACYRRHPGSDTSQRARTGVNIRERVAAIGIISTQLPERERRRATRRALLYAIVFATRSALASARKADWSAAARQGWEAVRCLTQVPRGVPAPAVPGRA